MQSYIKEHWSIKNLTEREYQALIILLHVLGVNTSYYGEDSKEVTLVPSGSTVIIKEPLLISTPSFQGFIRTMLKGHNYLTFEEVFEGLKKEAYETLGNI